MTLRGQKLGVVLGAAMVVTTAGWPLGAQEARKPETSPPATARKAGDPVRRVPDFFGQIALTKEQREEIYTIRARHLQRIGELEAQVAQARAQMLAECEKVLNDTQKQSLETRRRAAAEKKRARTQATEPAPPAKTDTPTTKPAG